MAGRKEGDNAAANKVQVGARRRLGLRPMAPVMALAFTAATVAVPAARGAGVVPSPLCLARSQAPAIGVTSSGPTWPDPASHPGLQRWTLASRAMSGATITVNVLVPPGYSPAAATPYKALYLLHGHGGGADDWWKKADGHGTPLEGIVGRLPLILVMPDGGYDGWYSDWYGVDVDGHNGTDPNRAPAWETFHVDELVPFVDAHYRTEPDRGGRLIAGLSMGGFGAVSYAARHPKLFATVGSFSGAVDTRLDDPAEPLIQPVAQNLPDRKPPDNCVWGDGITQHDVWVAHNPADQVAGLETRGARVALYASSGDGCLPGLPACQSAGLLGPGNAGAIVTEWGIRQQNESFRQKLEAYCAPSRRCAARQYDFYSPGIHDWSYWLPELGKFLQWAHGQGAV